MGEEIDIVSTKLDGLKELIEEKFDTNEKSHQAIIVQTTRTNGRVTKAEDRLNCIESWQSELKGAWKLLLFMGFANVITIIAIVAKILLPK